MYDIYDVFISYRRKEQDGREQGKKIAHSIYQYLSGKGLKVFLDVEKMENGIFHEQLRWQVAHAPNYIFIATNNSIKFRSLPEIDYVAEELKCALDVQKEHAEDHVILPIIANDVTIPAETDASYAKEVHDLFQFHALEQLREEVPTEKDLKMILERVTKVNRGNLWNAGRRWLQEAKAGGHRFASLRIDKTIIPMAGEEEKTDVHLAIHAHRELENDRPLMELIANTANHLYLIGEGGIGKTTALMSIMENVYEAEANTGELDRNRLVGQVPLFIELSKAPDTYGKLYAGGVSTFIHRAVFQQVRQDLKVKQLSGAAVEDIQKVFEMNPDQAVLPVRKLFTEVNPSPEYLLLLDGLNEVSRTRIRYPQDADEPIVNASVYSMVLQEIKTLMTECPNVRIILTSRSKEQANWSSNTTLLYLSGVNDEAMRAYLKHLPQSRLKMVEENEKLREILRVPLFLTLFTSLRNTEKILSRGEIIHLFFHEKKEKMYTAMTRNEEINEDLRQTATVQQALRLTAQMKNFILDFILPEIAWRMEQADRFYITRHYIGNSEGGLDEIIERILTDERKTAVCGPVGREVYIAYTSASRAGMNTSEVAEEIIDRLGKRMSRVVASILDCAVTTLGILQTDGIQYGFVHHHLRDYFAAVYQMNKLQMASYLKDHQQNDVACQCLADWKAKPLHAQVRRFIGEALGEMHNIPVCNEDGSWNYHVPDVPCPRNLLKRTFDLFRNLFDGQVGYAVWNLLQILKDVRNDLAGEDFSSLDLRNCEMNGYSLGRQGAFATLSHSIITDNLLLPRGHTDAILSVAYSPDGCRIVTTSADRTAKVWDAWTMQEITTLRMHDDMVLSAVFSPNGKYLVTVSPSRFASVIVWDAKTLQCIGVLRRATSQLISSSACFSPDGQHLIVSSSDKTIGIWDVKTLKEIHTMRRHSKRITSVSFSPDGKTFASASLDNTVMIWDEQTHKETANISKKRRLGGYVKKLQYSPDGKKIATLSNDAQLKLWKLQDMTNINLPVNISCNVSSFSFDPYGCNIAIGSLSGVVHIWDIQEGQSIASVKVSESAVNCICPDPQGRSLVIVTGGNNIEVWNSVTMQRIGELRGHSQELLSICCSPDGQNMVVSPCGMAAVIWDLQHKRVTGLLRGHKNRIMSVQYRPDGRFIITASLDGTARIWDAFSKQEMGVLRGHQNGLRSARFSYDGKKIVTTSNDNTAIIWDAETLLPVITLKSHRAPVTSATFSPDGKYLITTSEDYSAIIWDTETYQIVKTLKHAFYVNSASYSSDQRYILTASSDRTIKLWDAQSFQEIYSIGQQTSPIAYAGFSPNNELIYAISLDPSVKLWRTQTKESVYCPGVHSSSIRGGVFCEDNQHMLTVSKDGTIVMQNIITSAIVHRFFNIPGLEVQKVNLNNLHPASQLSAETKELLYAYGAIVDERN